MYVCRNFICMLAVCLWFLASASNGRDEGAGAGNPQRPSVTMEIGAVRITSASLEVRCEVRNGTDQDIWILDGCPDDYQPGTYHVTNADVALSRDRQAITVRRRARPPVEVWANMYYLCYSRLRPREVRPEVFRVSLPLSRASCFELQYGLREPLGHVFDRIETLVLELGYYTADDLYFLNGGSSSSKQIRFQDSRARVCIQDFTQGEVCQTERAVIGRIEGARIDPDRWLSEQEAPVKEGREYPVELLMDLSRILRQSENVPFTDYVRETEFARRLLRFDEELFTDSAHQMLNAYRQIVQGQLDPNEIVARLNAVLPENARKDLLRELSMRQALAAVPKPLQLTPVERLEDLFYEFRIGLEEYSYGRQLLCVNKDLLDDTARQITDVYTAVAEGRLDPTLLAQRLDQILSHNARENMLRDLHQKDIDGR